MRVIQIHSTDGGGGGGIVAYNLMDNLCKHGFESELYVGNLKLSKDSRVHYLSKRLLIGNRIIDLFHLPRKIRIAVCIIINNCTSLKRIAKNLTGKEYTEIYNTEKDLEKIINMHPDIIHCHNLHSNYFDLSALINLSHKIPVVITLHDAWLLTGHCAHFFNCMRWKSGCGNCPNLSVYPSIHQDATAFNWKNRDAIYKQCKLYVTAPSSWVLESAKESILNQGIVKSQVIPNGIDLSVFYPGDKKDVRNSLHLPINKYIILFAANGAKSSMFKDYETLRKSLDILSEKGIDVLCIALGSSSNPEYIGNSVEIRFIPFISDHNIVAQYYRAADVYVHPAKAETFGLVIIEAEACGLPVIASAVGGIPELIDDGKTGYLVQSENAEKMAERIAELKENEMLRKDMGRNAAILAKERYDEKLMVKRYIDFYTECMLMSN